MSAKKYKIGDKVRVRTDLDNKKLYGNIGVGSIMINMGGKILTIRQVDCTPGHYSHYHVKENDWNWTDEMLEDYILEAKNDTSVIDDPAVMFDKNIKDLFDLYKV